MFQYNHAFLPLAGVFGAAGACSAGVCVVANDAAVELSVFHENNLLCNFFACFIAHHLTVDTVNRSCPQEERLP